MNTEELRILEGEKQKIMDEILEELETKSLKELFLEMGDKENRVKEVRDELENLYDNLHFYKGVIEYDEKYNRNTTFWKERFLFTQEVIDEFENDYSNYIQGGEGYISGYISGYLDTLNEPESEDESE